MQRIGKVLYILNENNYIHCEHDAIHIVQKSQNTINSDTQTQKIPINIIEQIIIFGPTTISDYLIKFCSEHKILVSYISATGSYYGGLRGKTVGNVLLRQAQYRLYDDYEKRLNLVKNIVLGKSINQKNMLLYAAKNAKDSNKEILIESANMIGDLFSDIATAVNVESVRGIEGVIATLYFNQFDTMIKVSETGMEFEKRSKKPPLNYCNALLSFLL